MITRKEATLYLDRIVEAKKLLDAPLRTDEPYWSRDNAYYLHGDEEILLIVGAKKLAEAIGHPYMLSSFNDNADKLSFHWKGIEIYDLYCGARKRIANKEDRQ